MYINVWQTLGIGPTGDKRAIKKAYAKKSRLVHPEEHPEEFAQLKHCYEIALKMADSPYYKQKASADQNAISNDTENSEVKVEEKSISSEKVNLEEKANSEEKEVSEEKVISDDGEKIIKIISKHSGDSESTNDAQKEEPRKIDLALRINEFERQHENSNSSKDANPYKTIDEATLAILRDYKPTRQQKAACDEFILIAQRLADSGGYRNNIPCWVRLFKNTVKYYKIFSPKGKASDLFPNINITAYLLPAILELPSMNLQIYKTIEGYLFPKEIDENWNEVKYIFDHGIPKINNIVSISYDTRSSKAGIAFVDSKGLPTVKPSKSVKDRNYAAVIVALIALIFCHAFLGFFSGSSNNTDSTNQNTSPLLKEYDYNNIYDNPALSDDVKKIMEFNDSKYKLDWEKVYRNEDGTVREDLLEELQKNNSYDEGTEPGNPPEKESYPEDIEEIWESDDPQQ